MPTEWYITGWDAQKVRDKWKREPAIMRHIARKDEPLGSDWAQADILGGRLLIKCEASPPLHGTIQADSDFVLLEDAPASIAALKPMLSGLGYSTPELNTVTNLRTLVTLLTTAGWNRPRPSADNSQLELESNRSAPNTHLAKIEERIPTRRVR